MPNADYAHDESTVTNLSKKYISQSINSHSKLIFILSWLFLILEYGIQNIIFLIYTMVMLEHFLTT